MENPRTEKTKAVKIIEPAAPPAIQTAAVRATAEKPVPIEIRVKASAGGWIVNGKEVTRAEYWQAWGVDPGQPLIIEMPAIVKYIYEV
mgnify:CR=1 FL=1